MSLQQNSLANRLLCLMSPDDFGSIAADLEPIRLQQDLQVVAANEDVSHCYFPDSGIGSMVALSPDSNRAEVGLVGRDGVLPFWPLLDCRRSTHEVVMQVPGYGHRIPVDVLMSAASARADMHKLLLRSVQALWTQTSYTAHSNAVHPVGERLARWILMCHDRTDGDHITLTHKFIAIMLAVRRASVTEALHILEGHRLIYAERGSVKVRDRTALEEYAHDAYGVPEREYARLIGPMSNDRVWLQAGD